jgi:Cu+-exporting ATPase
VGSAGYLRDAGVLVNEMEWVESRDSPAGRIDPARSRVWVAADGVCLGLIRLADPLRPHAAEAVRLVTELGIQTAMVTGDHAETAAEAAGRLGLADVHAEMLPEDKLAEVRRRQREGQRVGFVGDGLNDAPALAAADVGITFGAASDVAAGAADITILHHDLSRLPSLVTLSRRCLRVIRQNLFWAFFYNLVALPLAAMGRVPPGLAAAAMMISSISVVLNSLRLKARP